MPTIEVEKRFELVLFEIFPFVAIKELVKKFVEVAFVEEALVAIDCEAKKVVEVAAVEVESEELSCSIVEEPRAMRPPKTDIPPW